MGWAHQYIEQLKEGQAVNFRPRGNSMQPKIRAGQKVTVEPTGPETLMVGDIVLCRVGPNEYLHFVKSVKGDGVRRKFLIGNNRGLINGWTSANHVYGKLVRIE